jgi:hypothetical protein
VYQKQVVREEDDEEKVEEARDISMTDNPRLYGWMHGWILLYLSRRPQIATAGLQRQKK